MLKYTVVQKAPEDLRRGAMIIKVPDFLEEVKECASFRGQFTVTTVNYLRSILAQVIKKYDIKLNVYTDFNLSLYKGLSYSTDKDVAKIISDIVKAFKPEIFDAIVDHIVKNRSNGIKLIYYVAPDYTMTSVFTRLGAELLDKDDVDDFLNNIYKTVKTKQKDKQVE